jgi:hypothetical protein
MANLTRNFIRGRMNKVVDERLVPDGEYIDATNIRMGSTENSEIGVIENTKGNVPLTALAYLDGTPLSIDAVCIGSIADSANETIYWFVHDPNFTVGPTGKLDLIVSFNVLTNILTYHVISINDGNGINTTLNFNPSYLITGIDLVNDLLFFTDNYNAPRFINIRRGYANPTAGFIDFGGVPPRLEESLLVIKKPPTESPTIAPFNVGGENNYLEDRFICFAYRYRYADGEYSATSQWSEPAFIPNQFEFDNTSYLNEGMTNSCNAVTVTYFSGGPLVVGIDLLFKEADKNIIKVIEKLNKAELGIPNFSSQSFTFDNSKIFTVLSESELLRLYDNVPRFAQAQTIMGNRLMYGNYIEGYDLIDVNGNPTRLEYQTSLVTELIGFEVVNSGTDDGLYTIYIPGTISDSIATIDLTGLDLVAGASISLDFRIEHEFFDGQTPFPSQQTQEIEFTFSFVLPTSYGSVYDMATSIEFQGIVGTISTILPVYSPIIGAETSCDGTTLTDQVNCALPFSLVTANTTGSVTKVASGITGLGQPISIITSPGSDVIGFQIIAMQYVDDPVITTQTLYEYYKVTFTEAIYQKIASPKSLHSNRGYEIGIVYMDDFNRSTTALVSPYNTEHINCGNSSTKNSISVSIPTSQVAPAWATRFKFVCKADTAGYETIYTNLFFISTTTNEAYFLLEGENARKIEEGDRLIVKADTGGALTSCVYTTVLEKEAKASGFIVTSTGITPPSGTYMKINPSNFEVTQEGNTFINPGTETISEGTGGAYPALLYDMNIPDPAIPTQFIDYTVPAGSRIRMEIKWERKGTGDGNNNCERRKYTLDVTLVSSATYNNMYDWFVGDNVQAVLNSGTPLGGDVGGSGNCPIDVQFIPTIISTDFPSSNDFTFAGCTNYLQFLRRPTSNQLQLVITGTNTCAGQNQQEKRASSITAKITTIRSTNTLIFETQPSDTLPDVFFENNLSFPIDPVTGSHLSNGAVGDIDQNIALGIPGYFQTGFFNCFSFGNGAESYKIRDSIVGRTFNLGNRVTTVSAQDYKEAHRFADITYSGVYNQENNVNKLNEFNLGLLNYKNLETSFGPIQKMDGRETDVLTLQEDKISYVLAGKNLLSDSTGGGVISSVPEVLGTQIARIEKYGISSNPESYVQWGYDKYFTDVKRGAVILLKGNSPSEQLVVVSESNMRTWFRDTFITYPNNQMLGAFDPYMNEYVLCVTDRELPGEPQCLDCNVSQTFTLSNPDPLAKNVAEYCVDLGMAVGNSTVSWTVTSISAFGSFEVEVTYDGITYTSGVTTTSGSVSFFKSSNTINTATVTISVLDDVVLNVTAECPIPEELTIIEVVLTTNTDAAKTIHAEYRYQLGTFVGPLQSNLVLFQSGIINPLVSRYNTSTGTVGMGAFPPQGSTLTLQTNKIGTDNFVFNPASDKFRYLRSSVLYPNTPATISSLIAASTVATPISGGPTIYNTNFIVPPSVDGNYLYLIWDLRKSIPAELCYEATSNPDEICCQCAPCAEACISLIFSNESAENEAEIYLPSGLCGEGAPVTITLDPSEVTAPICITNAKYEISFGSVTIEISECGCVGCTENCTEYAVFTSALPSKVSYTDCNGNPVVDYTIAANSIEAICVQVGSPAPTGSGSPIIQATDSCGCCSDPDPCITFLITESKGIGYGFSYNDCFGGVQVVSLGPYESIQVCGRASIFFKDLGPFNYDAASIEIIDTCACVSGCTETCQSYTIACIASNASGSYTDCNGDTQSFSLFKGQSITICAPLGVPPTAVGSASVFTASTCGCCTPTCQEYKITFLGTVVQDYLVGYRDCTNTYVVDSFPYGTTDVYICAYVNTVPSVDGSLAIEDWTIEITNGCGCGF